MKNLILTFVVGLFLALTIPPNEVQAQSVALRSIVTGKLLDTVTNTASKSLSAAVGAPKSLAGVTVVITSISGTAGGTVRLFGSYDNVNFVRIAPTDSLIVDANKKVKTFELTNNTHAYYKVTYTGTGTMVQSIKAQAVWAIKRE